MSPLCLKPSKGFPSHSESAPKYQHACLLSCASHVWLFKNPWIVVCQAPMAVGFARQEYWSRLSFPPTGDLPDPGIELASTGSPPLAGGFPTTASPGKSQGITSSSQVIMWSLHILQLSPSFPSQSHGLLAILIHMWALHPQCPCACSSPRCLHGLLPHFL